MNYGRHPLSSVVLLFFEDHKCVPKHISRSFLAYGFLCSSSWYESDCLIHVFCAYATPLGLHGGSCPVVNADHPPHRVIHLIPLCNWKYFGTYLGILHISRDLVMRKVNKCFDLVMRKVNKYFGTYLGYLPTILTSPQCDTFQLIPVSF